VVAPRTLRTWWAGFGALWVFANSVKTQPWEWDNSSYFVWWQVATAVLVAHLLVDVWSRRGTHWTERAARAAVPVLVVGLVAGGPLSVLRTAQDRVGLWHTEEASFAVAVRERVPLGDLVLTAPAHAHPVPALSGRHVVMGFGGWLFSHGLDFRAYATEVDRMLAGDLDLVRDRGVDFVVDGPLERAHIATRDLGPGIFASDALTLVYEVEADGERWRLFAVDG